MSSFLPLVGSACCWSLMVDTPSSRVSYFSSIYIWYKFISAKQPTMALNSL